MTSCKLQELLTCARTSLRLCVVIVNIVTYVVCVKECLVPFDRSFLVFLVVNVFPARVRQEMLQRLVLTRQCRRFLSL
jgi:hypothetical protein